MDALIHDIFLWHTSHWPLKRVPGQVFLWWTVPVHLHLYRAATPFAWLQVPREAKALSLLQGHALASLPKMFCHGMLDVGPAASGRCLQGAPVVVTQLLGEPLVSLGQANLPVLPVAEVEILMWDIFEALAELQVCAGCEWVCMQGVRGWVGCQGVGGASRQTVVSICLIVGLACKELECGWLLSVHQGLWTAGWHALSL